MCTENSQCAGFSLTGSYTTETNARGVTFLTVKTKLVVPDKKWLSEEYASFFGIEMKATAKSEKNLQAVIAAR